MDPSQSGESLFSISSLRKRLDPEGFEPPENARNRRLR